MPIDPELIQQLSNRPRREERTVKAVVYGLHKTSPGRDLISLETAILPPIPISKKKRWTLSALLALPQRTDRVITGYDVPWGTVTWSWPDRTVIQIIDLRMQDTPDDVPQNDGIIPNIPAAEQEPLSLEIQLRREDALFCALDELLATPPQDGLDLQKLAGLYSGLIPTALYPYYWSQFPSSRAWLRPDAALSDKSPHIRPSTTPPLNNTPVLSAIPSASTPLPTSSGVATSPEGNESHPADLTPYIAPWLQRATVLAQSCKAQEIIERLHSLESRLRYPGFRLAFVGEFNRGKSTLINLLLERTFLPVGATSMTPAIISIVFGQEECIEVHFPNGRKEKRPLAEASWADLLTKSEPYKEQTTFPAVRVSLHHNWLRELDAEFLDTPGVNDSYGLRSMLASDILNQSDAAVLLIAAHSPVSQTEALFLEQEVIGKHVPHIMIVVSMLDRVEPNQRDLVMEEIRNKISTVSPSIPIIATQSLQNEKNVNQLLEDIRTQITRLAVKTERRAWRSRQIAGIIADYMQQLEKLGKEALSVAKLDTIKRAEALQEQQYEMQKERRQWDLIHIDFEKRAIHLEQELQHKLDENKKRILDTTLYDLSKTNDTKTWWEQDFPFRLRQHFLGLAREFEHFVLSALGQDMQWLLQQLQKNFHLSYNNTSVQLDTAEPISLEQTEVAVADMSRIRLFSRIGSGAATVIGYMLLGPVGSAVSIAGGIVSDQIIGKQVKQQRQLLENQVQISVEQTAQEYLNRASQRIEAFYAQILSDFQQQQATWETSKERLLQRGTTIDEEQQWQRLIENAATLSKEIKAILSQQ